MIENRQGSGDLKALGAWVEEGLGGRGGPHGVWHSALSPPREHSSEQ